MSLLLLLDSNHDGGAALELEGPARVIGVTARPSGVLAFAHHGQVSVRTGAVVEVGGAQATAILGVVEASAPHTGAAARLSGVVARARTGEATGRSIQNVEPEVMMAIQWMLEEE